MNFALDQILVAAAVLGALSFFVLKYRRSGKAGCDAGCCGTSKGGGIKRP